MPWSVRAKTLMGIKRGVLDSPRGQPGNSGNEAERGHNSAECGQALAEGTILIRQHAEPLLDRFEQPSQKACVDCLDRVLVQLPANCVDHHASDEYADSDK